MDVIPLWSGPRPAPTSEWTCSPCGGANCHCCGSCERAGRPSAGSSSAWTGRGSLCAFRCDGATCPCPFSAAPGVHGIQAPANAATHARTAVPVPMAPPASASAAAVRVPADSVSAAAVPVLANHAAGATDASRNTALSGSHGYAAAAESFPADNALAATGAPQHDALVPRAQIILRSFSGASCSRMHNLLEHVWTCGCSGRPSGNNGQLVARFGWI